MTHLDHKSHCQLYLTIQTHTHTHIHTQTECIIAELKAHTKISSLYSNKIILGGKLNTIIILYAIEC